MTSQKPKPVLVYWTDAQTISSMVPISDLKDLELVPCVNCGFLMHKDKEKVVLAEQVWMDYYQVKYVHAIPKSMITKIVRLK